ncbi:MAG: GNAT family N-acetyltransferase [Lachnospiraceae bacterium]|nr:GNAT family N-acetyltransferase [Lachnospiraceae bacterium]
MDEKFSQDFRHVCSTVFNYDFSQELFDRKFIQNIYGPSVLVVVYIDDVPSAARALWRNDIDGKEAYQPGDTCVMENCRGKGVFSIMTTKSIAFLPESAIIYNFPNPNSYPGYIKMGWKLLHDYNVRILTSYKEYAKEHPVMMDDEYAKWWVVGRELTYTKRSGHYFLLQKDHRPMCYRVLAEVNEQTAKKFAHTRIGFFFYKSEVSAWYNKRFALSHVVTRNPELNYIPTWKIDAI